MKAPLEAQTGSSRQSAASRSATARKASGKPAFVDNRPAAIAQLKLADAIDESPYMAAQRMRLGSRPGDAAVPLQRMSAPARNDTGLPDKLKSGVESLSGLSLDNVKVHYNSSRPAQLSALAYAQGADIHVAPGQERHLPHEAWHVVQQAQGRVRPTMEAQGVAINDDARLEAEAAALGERAVRMKVSGEPRQGNARMRGSTGVPPVQGSGGPQSRTALQGMKPVQRMFNGNDSESGEESEELWEMEASLLEAELWQEVEIRELEEEQVLARFREFKNGQSRGEREYSPEASVEKDFNKGGSPSIHINSPTVNSKSKRYAAVLDQNVIEAGIGEYSQQSDEPQAKRDLVAELGLDEKPLGLNAEAQSEASVGKGSPNGGISSINIESPREQEPQTGKFTPKSKRRRKGEDLRPDEIRAGLEQMTRAKSVDEKIKRRGMEIKSPRLGIVSPRRNEAEKIFVGGPVDVKPWKNPKTVKKAQKRAEKLLPIYGRMIENEEFKYKVGGFSGKMRTYNDFAAKYNLSMLEILAIVIYSSDDYKYINAAVANDAERMKRDFPTTNAITTRSVAEMKGRFEEGKYTADVLMSALSKLHKVSGWAYRGIRLTPEMWEKRFQTPYDEEEKVEVPFFNSTSTDKGVAKQFADGYCATGENPVVSVLVSMYIKTGYDISEISNSKEEKELLVAPGHKFKIVQILHSKERENDTGYPPAKAWFDVSMEQIL